MKQNKPTKKPITEEERIKENRKILRLVKRAQRHRDESVDSLCRGCTFSGSCRACFED